MHWFSLFIAFLDLYGFLSLAYVAICTVQHASVSKYTPLPMRMDWCVQCVHRIQWTVLFKLLNHSHMHCCPCGHEILKSHYRFTLLQKSLALRIIFNGIFCAFLFVIMLSFCPQLCELRCRLECAEAERQELQEELCREREAREKLELMISQLQQQMVQSGTKGSRSTSPAQPPIPSASPQS